MASPASQTRARHRKMAQASAMGSVLCDRADHLAGEPARLCPIHLFSVLARMSKPFAQSRFLRQVILFLSPFLFVLCVFEILFWQAGETWPVTRVIEYQREHLDALFLRGKFDQQICRYKYLGLREAKPRILALGSSRVMKFRTEMFDEGNGSFYNGTGLI